MISSPKKIIFVSQREMRYLVKLKCQLSRASSCGGEPLLDDLFTPTHLIFFLPAFLIWAGIYALPTIIAAYRDHHSRTPIIWINVLLGWSVIGWVVALVWAFTPPGPFSSASSQLEAKS